MWISYCPMRLVMSVRNHSPALGALHRDVRERAISFLAITPAVGSEKRRWLGPASSSCATRRPSFRDDSSVDDCDRRVSQAKGLWLRPLQVRLDARRSPDPPFRCERRREPLWVGRTLGCEPQFCANQKDTPTNRSRFWASIPMQAAPEAHNTAGAARS
jgi:hypothetical protein